MTYARIDKDDPTSSIRYTGTPGGGTSRVPAALAFALKPARPADHTRSFRREMVLRRRAARLWDGRK